MTELTASQKKAFMEIPLMKEIKQNYLESQRGSGRKMKGGSWWDDVGNWFKQAAVDVDAWLKKTKALSTVGKVVGAIGLIPGLNEFAPVGAAMSKAGEALGYGRKKGGRRKKMTGGKRGFNANDLAQHFNPLAGPRGALVGSGTMAQNYQSQSMRKIGSGFLGDASKAFLGFNAKDIENMDTKAVANLATAYKKLQPKMKGGATFPSHLQPFLTSKRIGGSGVSQAIGSIGNVGKVKF